MKRFLLALGLLALAALPANAATCFWVGGTGTWDNATDAAHWSSGTGGAGSTCAATGGVPKNAADTATFDGASGAGTVTVNTDLNITSIVEGAHTGTLTWATNNNNVTLQSFAGAGTATRSLSLGNGTWTITGVSGTVWALGATGLTFNANSSTVLLSATASGQRIFSGGTSVVYNNLTITDVTVTGNSVAFGTSNTFNNLTYSPAGGGGLIISSGLTITVTGTFSFNGSSTHQVSLNPGTFGAATLSVANASSVSWAYIQAITKAGAGSIVATSSFDGGSNVGITITPPSTGGGRCIGC